jgi:hypothetical protein
MDPQNLKFSDIFIPSIGGGIDLTGRQFGRLTVLHRAGTSHWKCQCSCGNRRDVSGDSLRHGETRPCGCLRRELTAERNQGRPPALKHGEAAARSPEYICWYGIIRRCCRPTDTSWERYGGRGITVCDRWRNSFEHFLADMGRKPTPQHSIDRINNDGDYEPANCRWATASEQQRNKRKPPIGGM